MIKKKKKTTNRKTINLPFLLGLLLLTIVGTSYWVISNLHKQRPASLFQKEGYLFNQPAFLEMPQLGTSLQKEVTADGSLIDYEFADTAAALPSAADELNIPSDRPVLRLVDVDHKQTTVKMLADLSSVKHVESVTFFAWGEAGGASDLKRYEATYDEVTGMWQSDLLVKEHVETGKYQVELLITKSNGRQEQVEVGEFIIDEPTIAVTMDAGRTDKGQFDLLIKAENAADAESVTVPIWSKEDQSDLKWYDAVRQADGTYKVRMDYEDFTFINGVYTAEAHWQGKNGLEAKASAGQAEINVTQPNRVRLLAATKLYEDRNLTKPIRDVAANSMAYVEGVVYNEELKIYKTEAGYIPTENISVNEMSEDIHFIAHRGYHQNAPENSLPSFYQATSWGVETDIQLTKDNQWVIMHDDTVDRMTSGSGKISDMTLEEIRKLRIDTGAGLKNYSESQLVVPTLDEFLTIMQSNQVVPVIEVKTKTLNSAAYDSLVQTINKYGMADRAVVISFEFNHLSELKKRLPNLHVQLLSDTFDNALIERVTTLGNNVGIDVHYSDAIPKIDTIALAQARGVVINLWTTPVSEFERVAALGINYLTTDYVN